MSDVPGDVIVGPADEWAEISVLIREHGGRLKAEDVVEAARNPASSLHAHFTWDDTEAARRYRLQQAGAIMRKFTIHRPTLDGRVIRVPALTRVPDSDDGYAPTQDIVTVDWVVQQKRMRLIASMEKLATELRHWDEFTAIADVIEEALAAN